MCTVAAKATCSRRITTNWPVPSSHKQNANPYRSEYNNEGYFCARDVRHSNSHFLFSGTLQVTHRRVSTPNTAGQLLAAGRSLDRHARENFASRDPEWLDNLKSKALDRLAGQRQHRQLPLHEHLHDRKRKRRGFDGFRVNKGSENITWETNSNLTTPAPSIFRGALRLAASNISAPHDRHVVGSPRCRRWAIFVVLRQRRRHAQHGVEIELNFMPINRYIAVEHQPQHDAPGNKITMLPPERQTRGSIGYYATPAVLRVHGEGSKRCTLST